VVAHELSHSWFGNLVGCESWSSFWLNESWTTYLERLILHDLQGDAARHFSYIIVRSDAGMVLAC
jgi:leukotriene-A4 hydrolase